MVLAQDGLVRIETVQEAPPAVLIVLGVAAAVAVLGIAVVGSVVRRLVSLAVFAAVAVLIVCLLIGADPFGIDLDFLRRQVEKAHDLDLQEVPADFGINRTHRVDEMIPRP